MSHYQMYIVLLSTLHIESTIVSGRSPVVLFTRSSDVRPTVACLLPLPLAVLPIDRLLPLLSSAPPIILPAAASRTIGVEEQSNCLLCEHQSIEPDVEGSRLYLVLNAEFCIFQMFSHSKFQRTSKSLMISSTNHFPGVVRCCMDDSMTV